ncbi:MAG: relaxase/mobilization nuclease domain-containing protein [Rhodopila sp.]
MIAKGNLHGDGGKLAAYLVTGEKGDRAELVQLRGFASDNIRDAFAAAELTAEATRCQKPFFHAYTRLAPGEQLTREQWLQVADREEKRLGFTGQPRAVSFHHLPDGSTHLHVAWFRIDLETMRAIDPGMFKNHLKELSRKLEKEFGLTPVSNDRKPDDKTRAPDRKEFEEARRLNTDLKAIRNTILDCWQRSDSGKALNAALGAHGLTLANGDRRDCFVVVDQAGGQHALNKKLTGLTLAETRDRLGDLDRAQLPSVDQAKVQQHVREAAREARQAERAGIELAAERAMQEARAGAQGRTDDVRPVFEAASRATEPVAPVYDRDADNALWEEKLAEAAIHAEAQKGQQQHADSAARETRGGAGEAFSGPENSPETSAELWDELSAWSTDTRPAGADEIEVPRDMHDADIPADQTAHEMFDGIEEALHAGTRAVSGAVSRLAKAIENILGGIFSFFGVAEPKLTPMQAELAARANDELAEAREAAAASREKEAAQDWTIFQQDRQQQQDELDIETGRRERPGDRERERERDWP